MSLNGTTVAQNLDSPYNYVPTRAVVLIFVSLFGVSTALHVGQAIYYRLWWSFPTIILAGLGETAGWSGRLWSTYNIQNSDAFMLQIVTTVLSPTPLMAAIFIIHGLIVARLGASYSRITPRLYSIIFITSDVITLAIQGTGGGIASSSDSDNNTKLGANIMLAGIVLQLVIILVYAVLASEFFLRYARDRPFTSSRESTGDLQKSRPEMDLRLKIMSYALGFSTVCLFIRGVYRVFELADGWNGRIISTQLYFNVLDGAMIVLTIYTMNFVHPGMFLRHPLAEPDVAIESLGSNHL